MFDYFTARHLLWLHDNGYLSALPAELGPYPLPPAREDPVDYYKGLHDDLLRWGVLRTPLDGDHDEGGESLEGWVQGNRAELMNPEVATMFRDLAGHSNVWRLTGTSILYCINTGDVEAFEKEFKDVDEYGLRYAVRNHPRAPFIIAVQHNEVLTALSTPRALVVTRVPLEHPPTMAAARALMTLLDPTEQWTPWEGRVLALPKSLTEKLSGDPATGRRTDYPEDPDSGLPENAEQRDLITRKLLEHETPGDDAALLAEIATRPVSSSSEVVCTYPTSAGTSRVKGVSVGVSFIEGLGSLVSYPVGNSEATRTIYYAPATEKNVQEAVASLVTLTAPPEVDLEALTGKPSSQGNW